MQYQEPPRLAAATFLLLLFRYISLVQPYAVGLYAGSISSWQSRLPARSCLICGLGNSKFIKCPISIFFQPIVARSGFTSIYEFTLVARTKLANSLAKVHKM